MNKQFELIREAQQQQAALYSYICENHVDFLRESVTELADKVEQWVAKGLVTPEQVGSLVAGLDILTGKNRGLVTANDLQGAGIHPDIANLQRLDNVDLNTVIRDHVMKAGNTWNSSVADNVAKLVGSPQGMQKVKAALAKIAKRVEFLRTQETEKKGTTGPSSGIGIKDQMAMKSMQRQAHGGQSTGEMQPRQPVSAKQAWPA